MSNNIIESIQVNLGLPPLQKVDPNIQEAKDKNSISSGAKLSQAAIPAVVAGFYRLSRTGEGCRQIQASRASGDWLNAVFGDKKAEVVEKVAQYANVTRDEVEPRMEEIATEAISISSKEKTVAIGNETALREYMSLQRHNILVYLPAAMQIGDLLNDNSMDDRTNKMEGPMSNLMHKIENAMARGKS